jgi:CheY-like chemotaxis protein
MSKSILVVEDNRDSREILSKLLELEGYKVLTACDGREGLALIASEQPDLIVTDVSMPEINGLKMIQLIRERRESSELPIVALTAYTSLREQAIENGANRAMGKPFDYESFLEHISQLLAEPASPVLTGV